MDKSFRLNASIIVFIAVLFFIKCAIPTGKKHPLHTLCMDGDADTIKSFLSNNIVDINVRDEIGNTPLHYACWYNNFDAVEFLLNKGADFTLKTKRVFYTPLRICIINGHFEIAKLLVKKGHTDFKTLLDYAVVEAHCDFVKLFLDNGADPHSNWGHLEILRKDGFTEWEDCVYLSSDPLYMAKQNERTYPVHAILWLTNALAQKVIDKKNYLERIITISEDSNIEVRKLIDDAHSYFTKIEKEISKVRAAIPRNYWGASDEDTRDFLNNISSKINRWYLCDVFLSEFLKILLDLEIKLNTEILNEYLTPLLNELSTPPGNE